MSTNTFAGQTIFPNGPAAPSFTNIRNGLHLQQNYQVKGNNQGLEQLRKQVVNPAQSKLANMQMGQLGRQSGLQKSLAAQQLAKGTRGMNPWMAMKSNIAGINSLDDQTRSAQLGIVTADRGQQVQDLMNQVGNEVRALQPDEFNINNYIDEKRAEDTAKFANWNEQMKAWAATQQAQAIRSSGKK